MIKSVTLKQVDGIVFAAKGDSNHWLMMDGPEHVGGTEGASRPKELLLMALAGCASSDVVSILRKKRVTLAGYEVRVSGQETDDHPKVFTDIHIEFVFKGDEIKPADVERAIELSSEKYCSVSAMLRSSVRITQTYRIERSGRNAHTSVIQEHPRLTT